MYNYFKGKITDITSSNITIEVNNIGYLVQVSNPSSFNINDEVTLYIYQYIREDLQILYGFNTLDSKLTFEKLLTVKGLGPKTAITISDVNPLEISEAIKTNNVKFFTSFPGIGPKLASQIIIDLKGKFKCNQTNEYNDLIKQTSISLQNLGFKTQEINNVLKTIDFNKQSTLNEYIKEALIALKQ